MRVVEAWVRSVSVQVMHEDTRGVSVRSTLRQAHVKSFDALEDFVAGSRSSSAPAARKHVAYIHNAPAVFDLQRHGPRQPRTFRTTSSGPGLLCARS